MDLGSILRLFFNCNRRGYAVMKAATPNFTSLMDLVRFVILQNLENFEI
jgi:hypothetical protein